MESSYTKKLLVFVVDNSPYVHKAFKLCLPQPHFEVMGFSDSHEAIEKVLEFEPDVIFVDIDTKPLNGYGISQKLKDLDSGAQNIPVILTASTLTQIDSDRFEVSRANAQLYKPFDNQQLFKVMNQLKPLRAFLDQMKQEQEFSTNSIAASPSKDNLAGNKIKSAFDPNKSHIKSLDQLIEGPSMKSKSKVRASTATSASLQKDSLSSQLTELTLQEVENKEFANETNENEARFQPNPLEGDALTLRPALETLTAALANKVPNGSSTEALSSKLGFNLQEQILETIQHEVAKYLSDPKFNQTVLELVHTIVPQLAEKVVRNEIQKLMGTQQTAPQERSVGSREHAHQGQVERRFEPAAPTPPTIIPRSDY